MFAKRLVALGLLGAVGCTPNLRALSAGHVGCPPDQIEISEGQMRVGWSDNTRTWVATCQGRRFRCTMHSEEQSSTTDCAPETSGGVVSASRQTRTRSTASGAPVVRRSIQPNGAVRFDVTVSLAGDAVLAVSVLPLNAPNDGLVTLQYPNPLDGARCQLQLMVNGQLTPIRPQSYVPAGRAGQWTFLVETTAIRAAASTGYLVGRICGHEFRLEPTSQQALVELMRRYDEERAFASANQPAAGPRPAEALPENPTPPTDEPPDWESGSATPAP